MSNLLKRVYTVNKDERVIDYNDLIKKKLEAIMESKQLIQMDLLADSMRTLLKNLYQMIVRKN